MKKPYKYFIAGVLTILLPIGLFILFIFGLGFVLENTIFSNKNSKDSIYILYSVDSPDQKIIAATFAYSGGGAAGWSGIKVNVRKSGENLDDREYIFSTNNGTDIQTQWNNDSTLQITYSTNEPTLSLYQKGWNRDKTVKILYNQK